jgi:hypothetical protein
LVITMRFNLLLFLLAASTGLTGALHAQTPPAPSTAQIGGVPVANLATSTLSTEADTYWVGEVFPLTHRVTGERRVLQSLAGAYDWNPTNLNADEWSTATSNTDTPPGGQAAQTFTQTTRAYGRTAGVIELPRGLQPVTLVTGTSTSGGPGMLTTDTFTIRTAPARVTLKPLPAPPPMGFAGAVGDFTLKASITATEVAVGEAVTWTMELAGAGNWPEVRGIPPRAVSKDFDVVTPAARPSLARGTLFDGSLTEDILLVPTKEGTYRLGPIKFTYFDPKVGKYQVLTSETFILKVGGGGAGLGPEPSITDVGATDPNETVLVPDAPPPVPLDPLSNPLSSIAPFSQNALGAAVAVPGALFVLFWLSLSSRRSRLTDPLRLQREAHEQMERLIGQIDAVVGESPDKLKSLLYSWQRAAAQFGGLTITEPTSAQVAAAIEKRRSGVVGSSWAQLWREANRVMYGEKTAIPADWTKRARAALSDAPVPSVPLFAIFLRRNLLPFLGCLVLLLALAPASARADAAADAYQKGEFAAAEAAWRTELAKNPTDAHLRYNVALALAQQDRWTESTAQALSAFVNDPSNPAIRWQFNLARRLGCRAHLLCPAPRGLRRLRPLVRLLRALPRPALAVRAACLGRRRRWPDKLPEYSELRSARGHGDRRRLPPHPPLLDPQRRGHHPEDLAPAGRLARQRDAHLPRLEPGVVHEWPDGLGADRRADVSLQIGRMRRMGLIGPIRPIGPIGPIPPPSAHVRLTGSTSSTCTMSSGQANSPRSLFRSAMTRVTPFVKYQSW